MSHFQQLHCGTEPLVLVNVWDAAAARIAEAMGCEAIATSSGAIAWSLGYADGEQAEWPRIFGRIAEIAKAVSAPVTVDIEHGYGNALSQVMADLLAVGVVGVNLEDSSGGTLVEISTMTDRIRDVRRLAPDVFINARIDTYLSDSVGDVDRLPETMARAKAYAAAGADGIFVPGLLEPDAIQELTTATPLPVNIMTSGSGLGLEELRSMGVKRVSLGTNPAEVSYGAFANVVGQFRNTAPIDTTFGGMQLLMRRS